MGDVAVADVAATIREYVQANMSALADTDLRDDDNIFEKGFVSSIFAMQLLEFIESTFELQLPDEYLTLRNFSSVGRMAEMALELKGAGDE